MSDPNRGRKDQGADAWGDHYYRDSQGREYNDQGKETLWSRNNQARITREQAETERIRNEQMQAEMYAQQQRDLQMWRDAWNRTGGLQFGIGSRGVKGLFPSLSSLEGWIIKVAAIFVFGFPLVYAAYFTWIDPTLKAINKGVGKVRAFFNTVVEGIKNFFRSLWDHFTWIFTVWLDRIRFIRWRPENISGPVNFFLNIVSLAMLVFTVWYLVDYYLKRKNRQQIPYIMPKDIWMPAAVLLGLSVIWWAVIRKFYLWTLFDSLYDTFCMTLWVVAIEWLIDKYLQKKEV